MIKDTDVNSSITYRNKWIGLEIHEQQNLLTLVNTNDIVYFGIVENFTWLASLVMLFHSMVTFVLCSHNATSTLGCRLKSQI